MSLVIEKTISINQAALKPLFSHTSEAFTINIVVTRSTTQQSELIATKIMPFYIMENEPIENANEDMDMLAYESIEDL